MDNLILNNGKNIPNIMLGSFQMDDPKVMDEIVETAVANGVYGFDTSPSYKTEGMLSDSIKKVIKEGKATREDFFVDTKIDSWQMIEKKGQIRPFVEFALKKTGLEYWDMLLIHWPQPEFLTQTWLAMEKLYEEGLVKNIGVCNFSVRHFNELERAGAHIVPMVVQNEIHPLNTEPELVEYCKNNNIIIQAYSPLCRMIPKMKHNALINILAEKYNVSVAQIILRWHVEMGFVPIVKTSSSKRVIENTDVFSFSLSKEDRDAISSLDEHFKIFLESRCCPGY